MTETQTRITNEMLEQSRDELYNAVWGLVEAIRQQRNSAEEQEELSRAIIEESNLTYLSGQQIVAQSIVATMKNNPELTHAELTKLIEDNYTPKESN